MTRILVVDDERRLQELVATNLEFEGYEVATAPDGKTAIQAFQSFDPDLILLDVMMPDMSGFEVLRRIRLNSQVPVIMVTARYHVNDRVRGLDLGADDYLVKPFSIDELQARVRSVLRRHKTSSEKSALLSLLTEGQLEMDLDGHVCRLGQTEIILQPLEFRLLQLLMEAKGRVLSHTFLIENAWESEEVDISTVRVAIGKLRTKLRIPPSNHDWIKTVHGVGYCLNPPK